MMFSELEIDSFLRLQIENYIKPVKNKNQLQEAFIIRYLPTILILREMDINLISDIKEYLHTSNFNKFKTNEDKEKIWYLLKFHILKVLLSFFTCYEENLYLQCILKNEMKIENRSTEFICNICEEINKEVIEANGFSLIEDEVFSIENRDEYLEVFTFIFDNKDNINNKKIASRYKILNINPLKYLDNTYLAFNVFVFKIKNIERYGYSDDNLEDKYFNHSKTIIDTIFTNLDMEKEKEFMDLLNLIYEEI